MSPHSDRVQAAGSDQLAQGGTSSTRRPCRPRLALALMVTAQFMVILDAAITNVALPTIQRSLGFSAVGVEGVITAYATAFGGLLILGGRLSDLFGHRRVFSIGLTTFGATSLACGLATSPTLLIAARIIQGLSAALLAPAALALLTTTFAEGARRNRALGVFGAATALGFAGGQVLGGVLTDTVGWRSIFLINLPVAVAAAALAAKAIPPDTMPARREDPDVLGAVLITSAVALVVWAPAYGAEHGASDVLVGAGVGALVLLVSFALVEARHRSPLVRLSMLRSRWLAGTNLATAVTGALNGTVVLLCTLYLQHVRDYSPVRAGLAFLPTGIVGLLVGVRLAGPLITRLGIRGVLTAMPLLSAGAIIGLSQLPRTGLSYLPLLPWLLTIGLSFTATAVATTAAVSAGVAPNEQGVAAALRQTAFQLGVALGVAVFLSIAAAHTNALLAHAKPPSHDAALIAGYRLSLVALAALSAASGLVAFTMLAGRVPAGRATQ